MKYKVKTDVGYGWYLTINKRRYRMAPMKNRNGQINQLALWNIMIHYEPIILTTIHIRFKGDIGFFNDDQTTRFWKINQPTDKTIDKLFNKYRIDGL